MDTRRSSVTGKLYGSWEGYMLLEQEQLAQRATGKMGRMIGRTLPGESKEELEAIAIEDQLLAQDGYVVLRQGDKVFYKHIDELKPSDRQARIAYEKTLVRWLKVRREGEKSAPQLHKSN